MAVFQMAQNDIEREKIHFNKGRKVPFWTLGIQELTKYPVALPPGVDIPMLGAGRVGQKINYSANNTSGSNKCYKE